MNPITGRLAAAGILIIALGSAAALAAPTTPFTTKVKGVPAFAKPNTPVKLSLTVTETVSVPNASIGVAFYDTANKSAAQTGSGHVAIVKGKPQTFTYTLNAPAKPGVYTIKVGVFNGGYNNLLSWNNSAGTLKVH